MCYFVSVFPVELGEIFASIGVRELQPNASEAFAIFSEAHRYFCPSINQFIYSLNSTTQIIDPKNLNSKG